MYCTLYTWTDIRTIPCRNYTIRIRILGISECKDTIQVPAESQDYLIRSGYRPQAPRNVKITRMWGSVMCSWTHSPCATNYNITYTQVPTGKVVSKQIEADVQCL